MTTVALTTGIASCPLPTSGAYGVVFVSASSTTTTTTSGGGASGGGASGGGGGGRGNGRGNGRGGGRRAAVAGLPLTPPTMPLRVFTDVLGLAPRRVDVSTAVASGGGGATASGGGGGGDSRPT